MKEMINLALRTEYSFQRTYGFIDEVIATQDKIVGVADINNTFSHFYLNEKCKEAGKKPIFGVRLMVVKTPEERLPPRGQFGPEYIFIAKNYDGLIEIHKLVERSYDCFYYRAHIGLVDVWQLSENVIVIAPHFELDERIDYIAVCNITSPIALASSIPKVAINNNWMVEADDWDTYELFAGKRKVEKYSFAQHILSTKEWMAEFNDQEAINNTHVIADMCNVEFPKAETVTYKGADKIKTLCRKGAKQKNINLKDPIYKARLKRELNLIKEKNFTDYFLIVYEMVYKAKKEMLVGPSRGSSAGSLVCYLLGITEVDPIKWDLIFERFIDVNRFDMPDIDVDFPDNKRSKVIKELIRTNGRENVKNIATVSKMNARGAIGDFSKELGIPTDEVEVIKNSIISRSGGDARQNYCIMDTFTTTETGKAFIKKYPQMVSVGRIEKHSRHSGTHAAGIIVATQPLHNFASIDPRDNTIQMEGKPAEKMNLLKIDVLGLSTLAVLEEIAELIGMDYHDYYTIEADDDKVFKLFRELKVKGIFQFEGHALAGLCRSIKVRHIEDIIAITALARPGPLHGGGAAKFSKIHSGQEEVEYVMKDPDVERITKKTMGVIVYQEQIMQILREVGGFPWKNVGTVRKLISKKSGKELINKFRDEFISGAVKKGIDKEDVEIAWKKILEFAQYGFNRCISEDTKVRFAHPNQSTNKFIQMKELYRTYVSHPNESMKSKMKNQGLMPSLLSLYPDGIVRPQRIKKIMKNGIKKCYRYTLNDGSAFKCTKEHKFIINNEWMEIGNAKLGCKILIGEIEKQKHKSNGKGKGHNKGKTYSGEGFPTGVENPSYINGRDSFFKEFKVEMSGEPCEECGAKETRMEAHHNDFNHGKERPEDLSWLCVSCHKKIHYKKIHYKNGRTKVWGKGYKTNSLMIIKIEYAGEMETYDIEMEEHHNYLLEGGIITHNSHAVAYGLVSYWTAWAKVYHPLEFLVSNLNHPKNNLSSMRLIREMKEDHKFEFIPFEPKLSEDAWKIINGKIVGPLTNVDGIGKANAGAIMKRRISGATNTASIQKKLDDPVTKFDILYPCEHYWGGLFKSPKAYGLVKKPTVIKKVDRKGTYFIVAQLIKKNVRDLNELQNVMKRGGEVYDEHTKLLNITVEDDTGSLMCRVNRFDFDKLGKEVAEEGEEETDWYLIKGNIIGDDIIFLFISEIHKLGDGHSDGQTIKDL